MTDAVPEPAVAKDGCPKRSRPAVAGDLAVASARRFERQILPDLPCSSWKESMLTLTSHRVAQVLIGLALLSVTIMPIWVASIFPSLDGPVHVYLADILRFYWSSPFLQDFFAINSNLEPNFLVYPVLFGLLDIFDGPTAEKILVTGLGIAFFTAAVYTVRSFHPAATWLALLFLPFTYNDVIYQGFYNYFAGLCGFLFGLGYWCRHRRDLTVVRLFGFAIIVTLTVLAHLMGFLFLAYTIAVMQIVMWLMPDQAERRPPFLAVIRQSAGLGLAFLPAVLLVGHFFWRYHLGAPDPGPVTNSFWLARQLVTMSVLFVFDPTEAIWLGPLLIGLAYLIWCAIPLTGRRPAAIGLVVAMAGLVLVYFYPVTTKGAPIHDRIQAVLYMLAVLWAAACYQPERRRRYAAIAALAAVVTVAGGLSRAWHHRQIDAYARDYLSLAAAVEPETTIVGANSWRQGQLLAGKPLSWRIDPFRHLAADLALGKRSVFLEASLLSRNRYGYFPIYYRPAIDLIRADSEVDLSDYNHTRHHPVDYMILWPVVDGDLRPFGGVPQDYVLMAKSTPLGLAYLYRYRPATKGGSDASGGADRQP